MVINVSLTADEVAQALGAPSSREVLRAIGSGGFAFVKRNMEHEIAEALLTSTDGIDIGGIAEKVLEDFSGISGAKRTW